jgi:NAD(P)-dependent dehydrogenase (short-subunit alcohol dehydrogenase family)
MQKLNENAQGINTSAYNTSKSALHQLARSLATEWGHPQNTFSSSVYSPTGTQIDERRWSHPTIRVNTISPGHIETPMIKASQAAGLTDVWASQNMLGRISQKEEYRAPCLFLLGEGSSFMTGAVSATFNNDKSTVAKALIVGFENRWWALCLVAPLHDRVSGVTDWAKVGLSWNTLTHSQA